MVQFLEGKECSRLGEVKESRAAKPRKAVVVEDQRLAEKAAVGGLPSLAVSQLYICFYGFNQLPLVARG